MSLSISQNFYIPVNFDKAIWLHQISAFFEKSDRLSPAGPEVLAFGSHCACSAKFQPIVDCFMPTFKLKYEDSKNINTDCVDTVVFNLNKETLLGTPSLFSMYVTAGI